MKTTLISNGVVVNETGATRADVLLCGEKIAAVGQGLSGDSVIDAEGRYVMPGLIDSHVHYCAGMGQARTADDFVSGSVCAACGGVTTVLDYAPPRQGMSLPQALAARQAEIDGYAHCDYSLHAEILGWHRYEPGELPLLRKSGVNSLKIYTTYGADRLAPHQMERLFVEAAAAGLRVCIHAEDDEICRQSRERLEQAGRTGYRFHAQSRPAGAEGKAITDALALAQETGAPIHIVHVSTKMGIEAIAEAKRRGIDVTCETCPHYLVLGEERYEGEAAAGFIMTPPLRQRADREALWAGVMNGSIDSIVSDHCAFTWAQKTAASTCFYTLPGIPGTETILPLLYTEGQCYGLTLARIVQLFSAAPAKLFGIYPQKGCIAPGADADLCIWDPAKDRVLSADSLHSRCGYSPYQGMRVKGSVFMTLRRGEVLVQGGEFTGGKPGGRFVPAP